MNNLNFVLRDGLKGPETGKEVSRPQSHKTLLLGDRMKQCKRCGKPKPVSAFYSRRDRLGYYAWCIECCNREGRLRDTKTSLMQYEKSYIR